MREKLFKLLFPSKAKKIKSDAITIKGMSESYDSLMKEYKRFEFVFGDYVPLDFSNVDDGGKPPHYLKGLTDVERKNFIATLESMYADPKLQAVFTYVINVIANYSFQKEPDETKMRNGRYAVIGVRTLMSELEKAHAEYRDSKKPTEEFDPLETLPSN